MTYRPYESITAVSIADSRQNVSGVSMPKGTPVRSTPAGDMDFIDVSIEAHAFAASGITQDVTPNLSNGAVLTTGRLVNLSTSFNFGDAVYVSKTGGLTNLKPTIGIDGFVSGDYIVAVGVIGKNAENPSNKDLIINIGIVGQL
jgi:hypothetical protein